MADYKSDDYTLGQLLSVTSPPMRVPEWQRNYSWSSSEINIFWQDLQAFMERYPPKDNPGITYFMGSIVLVNDGHSQLLLDGQQRLATATILLSVIRDFLRGFLADASVRTENKYMKDFDDASGKTTYKLTLNKFDRDFFRRCIQESDNEPKPTIESHRLIAKAKEIFTDKFTEKYEGLGGGKAAFQWALEVQDVLTNHMSVVGVLAENEDRAAEVFETLNDRGIGLSTADLVRNLILRRANPDEVEAVIDCWSEVLEVEEEVKVADFLRHYWLSQHGDVKTRSLYREIKANVIENDVQSLEFSRSLQSDAIVYRDIATARSSDPEVQRLLIDVRELNATVLMPPLLSGFVTLGKEKRVPLLKLLISAYVRHNVIAGYETSKLESIMYTAAKRIRGGNSLKEVADEIKESLPNDGRFQSQFASAEVTKMSTARYILKQLEHHKRVTGEVGVEAPDKVHVEHIYPKTPIGGNRWQSHNVYINRIGNLTLLARRLNIQIRNGSFEEKLPTYQTSDLFLTKELEEYQNWTSESVELRQHKLSELATTVWQYPDL